MLVEFRVANFRSFQDEQVLSLVASKDETHPGNAVHAGGLNLLKAAAIYGPNASGKSNLIKAIWCMKSFVLNSARTMNLGEPIPNVVPFRLAEKTRDRPCRFAVTFLQDKTRFEYGFAATMERVHEEWLFAHPPGGRQQHWLERRFDERSGTTAWSFRGPLKREERLLKQMTRDNGLVLSRGAELNIEPLRDPFLWFRHLWWFDLSKATTVESMGAHTPRGLKDDPDRLKNMVRLLRHADMGIADLRIVEDPLDREKMSIHTVHQPPGTDREELFDLMEDEALGTQRFVAMLDPILEALDQGAVLVFDELGSGMHSLLSYKLLEFFQSPEANPRGAQIVFATHDSTLMDPQLFRRDQIWLVEKDRGGASKMRSLYDFTPEDRPRNTEAFQRNYLAGRYGAVPSFGPIFEKLSLK